MTKKKECTFSLPYELSHPPHCIRKLGVCMFYTCFQVFLPHHGAGRCQWLQYQVLGMEIAFFHGAVNIADSVFVARTNMEVGAHFHPAVPDGIGNVLEIIYRKLLRNYIYNLVAGRDIGLKLVGYQLVYFPLLILF